MIVCVRPVRAEELDAAMNVIEEGRAAIAKLNIDQWQSGAPGRKDIEKDISLNRLYGVYDEIGLCAVGAMCGGVEPCYDGIQGKWLKDGTYLTVHRVACLARARHSSAAQALIAEAEKLARAQGLDSVRVDTHRGNVVMQRFMEKTGFTNCGIVDYTPDIVGDPLRIGYEKLLME